jgi:hypothetical protein
MMIKELSMQKQSLFRQIRSNRIWAMALVGGVALVLSACSTSAMSSNAPTPTTVMGVKQSPAVDQAMSIPSQIPTESSAALQNGPASGADVCSLVSKAEAEAVLGKKVISMTPGSDSNILPGATINFCTYLAGGTALVISSIDSSSASAASELLKVQLAKAQAVSPDLAIQEESGLGSKAYWTVNKNAAGYTILKDNHVFSAALGGKITDAGSYKAALLTLANSILSKY